MLDNLLNFSLTILLIVIGLVLISMAVRIIPEYKRLVVFRLGRSIGAKGPGIIFLIPFLDRAVSVDLREVFFDVPPQTCITADNASVSIDFLVFDKDDVLSKRDEINQVLHEKLDQVTDRWGIRVMAVEIREVVPPRAIEEAMTRQMAAERNRRAMVAEAEGKREAAVTIAEGQKDAAILEAEGKRRSTILGAEGERQAAILNAEGYALALGKIFETAKDVDSKTLTLQYLEALKGLGAGAATKFIIPTELMNLAQPLGELAKKAHNE